MCAARFQSVRLGYWIDHAHQGLGVGTAAVAQTIRRASDDLDLHRSQALRTSAAIGHITDIDTCAARGPPAHQRLRIFLHQLCWPPDSNVTLRPMRNSVRAVWKPLAALLGMALVLGLVLGAVNAPRWLAMVMMGLLIFTGVIFTFHRMSSGATCALCGAAQPAWRRPADRQQAMWGGWTCGTCGTHLDREGRPRAAA